MRKRNQFLRYLYKASFPEIDTGEQGPPIGFVISTSQDYGDLANVAGKFLEDMQKSSKFVYTNLDLKFDTAQMRIKIDREKAGTYGITMQQISRTLGSFLSAATIERVILMVELTKLFPK